MRPIFTSSAPKPAGHYSQAMIHNDLVYVSGQLPIEPHSGPKEPGDIEEQTRQVLENVSQILRTAGTDRSKVLKVTVYISDISLWDRVNSVYSDFFQNHKPARVIVPTRELHFGYQIEVDAIAAI